MIRALSWKASVAVAYCYGPFPIIVLAKSMVAPRPHRHAEFELSVTVVIPAYKETHGIGQLETDVEAGASG